MDILAALGWIGAALSLASYILVSMGRLSAQSLSYQGLMLAGSSALAVSCAVNGAWPSLLTNSVFVLIGVLTIAVLFFRPGSALRRVLGDARRAVCATGRLLAQSARTFARPARSMASVSVLGHRRDEIDELLETTQQARLEVPVVAHAA